jgi:hypothetical protein
VAVPAGRERALKEPAAAVPPDGGRGTGDDPMATSLFEGSGTGVEAVATTPDGGRGTGDDPMATSLFEGSGTGVEPVATTPDGGGRGTGDDPMAASLNEGSGLLESPTDTKPDTSMLEDGTAGDTIDKSGFGASDGQAKPCHSVQGATASVARRRATPANTTTKAIKN